MEYLIKFDENGRRCETYVKCELDKDRINSLLSGGYIEVAEADYQLLIGNIDGKEYIRNNDGTYSAYVVEVTLEDVKSQKKDKLKQGYLKDVEAVVWVQHLDGKTYGYDTDKYSQIDFNSSYQRAQISGTTRYNVYVNKNDLTKKEFLAHNPAMFELVLEKAGIYQENVYAKYYQKKQEVEAATSKEEVEKISW